MYEDTLTTSNIFQIQDRITEKIVSSIAQVHGVIYRSELSAISRRQPKQLGAYDCVLKTFEYYRSYSAEEHLSVRSCLQDAIETEPDYAKAWTSLALVYIDEYRYDFNRLPEPLVRADRALQKALELDPDDAMAHMQAAILGFFQKDIVRFDLVE